MRVDGDESGSCLRARDVRCPAVRVSRTTLFEPSACEGAAYRLSLRLRTADGRRPSTTVSGTPDTVRTRRHRRLRAAMYRADASSVTARWCSAGSPRAPRSICRTSWCDHPCGVGAHERNEQFFNVEDTLYGLGRISNHANGLAKLSRRAFESFAPVASRFCRGELYARALDVRGRCSYRHGYPHNLGNRGIKRRMKPMSRQPLL